MKLVKGYIMTATLHASERFLQRVFQVNEYTREDIKKAALFLENEFHNVHTIYKDTIIALPTFPSMTAVIRDGMYLQMK